MAKCRKTKTELCNKSREVQRGIPYLNKGWVWKKWTVIIEIDVRQRNVTSL